MVESNVGIMITTNGASEAAAALGQVSNGMAGVGVQHNELKGKFQEKFQHLGLMLFAGDAVRAAGLGRETRVVINTLNLALSEGAAAAGISSGGFLLIVTALTALAAVIVKVVAHHKDEIEQLEKLIGENNKLSKTYTDNVDAVNKYTAEVGHGSKFIDAYAESQAEAKKVTDSLTAAMHLQVIAALSLQIAKLEDVISEHKKLAQMTEAEKQSMASYVGGMNNVNMAVQKAKENYAQQNDQLTILQGKRKQEEADVVALHAGYSTMKDMLTDLAKAHHEEAKEAEDANKATLKDLNEQANASYETFEAEKKSHEQMMKKMEEQAHHTFNTINNEQSQAFAKMVVEGESFASATAHLWRNIAEQVIAQIERMVVEWLMFQTLTGGFGMGVGAANTMLGTGFQPTGFASGGSVLVDRPTLMMAGEAGPELATFTPLSSGGGSSSGGSGGGSSVQVGSVVTNIYGVQDPDAVADQVGRKIIQRIRGMGEQNFLRTA